MLAVYQDESRDTTIGLGSLKVEAIAETTKGTAGNLVLSLEVSELTGFSYI